MTQSFAPAKKTPLTFDITTGALPASSKRYIGQLGVPVREIALSKASGEAPVCVYDTSGPYTDPHATIDIYKGLPKLRDAWIRERGDVEEYDARIVKPEDNGARGSKIMSMVEQFPHVSQRPLRAKAGKAVTQYAYAKAGIITKEMEFIAIRENEGRAQTEAAGQKKPYQRGEGFGARIPDFVTAELVLI
jgi:phosphomethylpyrimidine synthase